jgi:hypothetical protein
MLKLWTIENQEGRSYACIDNEPVSFHIVNIVDEKANPRRKEKTRAAPGHAALVMEMLFPKKDCALHA